MVTEQKEPYRVTKGNHGGRRVAGPGKKIGRPDKGKSKRVRVTFRLSPMLVDRLKKEENQSGLIAKLLSEYYGVSEL